MSEAHGAAEKNFHGQAAGHPKIRTISAFRGIGGREISEFLHFALRAAHPKISLFCSEPGGVDC